MTKWTIFLVIILSLVLMGVSGCSHANQNYENNSQNYTNFSIGSVSIETENVASAEITSMVVNSESDVCAIVQNNIDKALKGCMAAVNGYVWTATFECQSETYCAGLMIIDGRNGKVVSYQDFSA
jgi:hypothetical protein